MHAPLVYRLKTGMVYGLFIAAGFSLFVTLMRLVLGPEYGKETGFSLLGIILAYFAAGLVGGFVGGLFWPMGQTLLGRMVLGFFVMWPAMAIFGLPLLDRAHPWSYVLDTTIIAAFIGPISGAATLAKDGRRPPPRGG